MSQFLLYSVQGINYLLFRCNTRLHRGRIQDTVDDHLLVLVVVPLLLQQREFVFQLGHFAEQVEVF